jgi:hypothetical protein
METITPKKNYISGIFRKIMVRALDAQKRNVHFVETDFVDLMDIIVVPLGILVHSNYRFRSQGNVNNANLI